MFCRHTRNIPTPPCVMNMYTAVNYVIRATLAIRPISRCHEHLSATGSCVFSSLKASLFFAGFCIKCWPFVRTYLQALPDGILNNLVTMINFMKEGEFVKANDIYLLTAIGNAPWPIGLTMVGIHERSGMHGCFVFAPVYVSRRISCVLVQCISDETAGGFPIKINVFQQRGLAVVEATGNLWGQNCEVKRRRVRVTREVAVGVVTAVRRSTFESEAMSTLEIKVLWIMQASV